MSGPVIETGPAGPGEAEAVAQAVTELLRELRGDRTHTVAGIVPVAAAAIAGADGAGVLVAREPAKRGVVGVLGYTVQPTMRLGGPYCLVQELWVDPGLRSRGVAGLLLAELDATCAAAGIHRIEVCLPSPGFADYPRTLAFYERSGFRAIGPRVLKDLP
ncbi:GNAT family N-acetyltransferase [Kitasatospora sp. NPDC056138]|uniref:GNAT family N-acetyltransferase n=1 Tax=Kitasatospora sp. NPDC056138 TaxID=3345724 RepID=UPI0035E08A70